MIGKLKGIVDEVAQNWAILDVAGVGYHVFCTQKTLDQLPQQGEAMTLYIETIVREDFIHLYGFASVDEKLWFNVLTTVQGVGMKAALSILSALSPSDVYQAITTGQTGLLTSADGIGPKLATRIIHELKDKAHNYKPQGTGTFTIVPSKSAQGSTFEDVVSALTNLGYRLNDAQHATHQAFQSHEGAVFQDLLKIALEGLSKSRTGS